MVTTGHVGGGSLQHSANYVICSSLMQLNISRDPHFLYSEISCEWAQSNISTIKDIFSVTINKLSAIQREQLLMSTSGTERRRSRSAGTLRISLRA